MHLDFDQSAAFAILAASTFHIETEPAGIVSAHTRRRQLAKKFTNRSERAGVGDRIRARRSSDRALIDHDGFVDMLHAKERSERSRFFFRVVEMTKQRPAQNIIDQRRFSAARNARDAGQADRAERKRDDRFQIIFRGALTVSQPTFRARPLPREGAMAGRVALG